MKWSTVFAMVLTGAAVLFVTGDWPTMFLSQGATMLALDWVS